MLARVTARYAEVGKACKSQTEKKQLSLITGSMSEIQFRDDRKKDGRSDAKPFFSCKFSLTDTSETPVKETKKISFIS